LQALMVDLAERESIGQGTFGLASRTCGEVRIYFQHRFVF